jgi:hypothetical protein
MKLFVVFMLMGYGNSDDDEFAFIRECNEEPWYKYIVWSDECYVIKLMSI